MGSDRPGLRSALTGALGSAIAVLAVLFATGNLTDEDREGTEVSTAAKPARAAAALADVYERSRRGVVLIDHRPPGVRPRRGPPRRNDGVATGSGFVIAGRAISSPTTTSSPDGARPPSGWTRRPGLWTPASSDATRAPTSRC